MENWQFALWPLLSHARRRAADHWYALWPLATWACYDEDRDTSGAGYSWMFWPCYGTALGGQQLYMLDCWLWDLRYEEDKIAGNTRDRDRGEKQGRARVGAGHFEPALAVQSLLKSADRAGLHRADPIQEAQVAVATLPASAQGKGCPGMNTTYTVKHIQKGLTLFTRSRLSPMRQSAQSLMTLNRRSLRLLGDSGLFGRRIEVSSIRFDERLSSEASDENIVFPLCHETSVDIHGG